FQAWEANPQKSDQIEMLDENTDRVRRQNAAPITVIFGNPPYSAGQKSANDDAKNRKYKNLDEAVRDTYVKLSGAQNCNAMYDSYIRAFRFATDRLKGGDGIICYVSNGGWLDGNAAAGFRKTIEGEFAKIYVFNLRGDQRTSGELSRREGGKIFGGGSRTPVAITLLVKRAAHNGKAEIFYRNIGDYLKREEKLETIKSFKGFCDPAMQLEKIAPNKHGDWISTRDDTFQSYVPLAGKDKFDAKTKSVFVVHSRGFATARDAWVYNFSKENLEENIKRTVNFYNGQLSKAAIDYNKKEISWTGMLLDELKQKKELLYENEKKAQALYRPFQKQNIYYGQKLIHRRGQFDKFFPRPDTGNLVICVSGVGSKKDHTVLMANMFVDLNCMEAGTQCFPLHYYEAKAKAGKNAAMEQQINLQNTDAEPEYIKRDGISDFIFKEARGLYGNAVSKEDIFFYVYGFLHSKGYRAAFASDLKKSLPRIPLQDIPAHFWSFSKAGRKLADLHLNYESLPPPDSVTVTGSTENLRVQKMKFAAKGRKDTIIYNEHIKIENIPANAYEYIVNGKPAIEWIMDRYQIKTDKDSGITNDPNLYVKEAGKPAYMLDLLLSVIEVSLKTTEIVSRLP
ncbi:MAG: hypothetical protein FWE82_04550, partial [Defluviitaleaceae bacterium]|nr:hypothetical protein [Defluviitaleaceae bacterium]